MRILRTKGQVTISGRCDRSADHAGVFIQRQAGVIECVAAAECADCHSPLHVFGISYELDVNLLPHIEAAGVNGGDGAAEDGRSDPIGLGAFRVMADIRAGHLQFTRRRRHGRQHGGLHHRWREGQLREFGVLRQLGRFGIDGINRVDRIDRIDRVNRIDWVDRINRVEALILLRQRGFFSHRHEREGFCRENRVCVDAHAVQRGLTVQFTLVIEGRVLAVEDEILVGAAEYLSRGAALSDILAVAEVKLLALSEHQPHIAVGFLLRCRRGEVFAHLVG